MVFYLYEREYAGPLFDEIEAYVISDKFEKCIYKNIF